MHVIKFHVPRSTLVLFLERFYIYGTVLTLIAGACDAVDSVANAVTVEVVVAAVVGVLASGSCERVRTSATVAIPTNSDTTLSYAVDAKQKWLRVKIIYQVADVMFKNHISFSTARQSQTQHSFIILITVHEAEMKSV